MGKKYKVVHKHHGKKLKKGQELEADELSLSRSAGKPGCYRALQCLGILLTMNWELTLWVMLPVIVKVVLLLQTRWRPRRRHP